MYNEDKDLSFTFFLCQIRFFENLSGHGGDIFEKELDELITHTHDKIFRLWHALVYSGLTRYLVIV